MKLKGFAAMDYNSSDRLNKIYWDKGPQITTKMFLENYENHIKMIYSEFENIIKFGFFDVDNFEKIESFTVQNFQIIYYQI
jgi:hypothetical protein